MMREFFHYAKKTGMAFALGATIFLPSAIVHADIIPFSASALPVKAGPLPLRAVVDASGGETIFHVEPAYDIQNRLTVNARHLLTGEKAYIYVDATFLNSLSGDERTAFTENARQMLSEFDERIYPMITQIFGAPWEPGIDNDPRITILLSRLTETTAGYFNPRDEFTKENVADSNEREMIYLNTRFIPGGRGKMFLAHEFQHLISFYWKDKILGKSDDVWLNELRSEYVPTLLGYDSIYNGSNLEHRVSTLLKYPDDSLTEWRNAPPDYGSIALFGQYLADQYSVAIFREIMRARSVGIVSVEDALKALGRPAAFEDVFAVWTVANYVNDISGAPQYGYFNSRLRAFHLAPIVIANVSSTIPFSLRDWTNAAWQWYGIGSGTLGVTMRAMDSLPARFAAVRIEKGEYAVTFANMVNGFAAINLPLSSEATYVIIPVSMIKKTDFGENESQRQFEFTLTTAAVPVPSLVPENFVPKYPDGALIRAVGDYKVYVTKGLFKRHIVSADIFRFYGHFSFQNVIDVPPADLAQYKLSAWVRADGDPRVWEINGDGTKHWINIPGEQFAPSGRDWNGVYIVNARERDWYVKGVDVMR